MTNTEKTEVCNRLATALMDFAVMLAPSPAPAEKRYTPKELAVILGKSPDNVREKIRSGEFGPDAVRDGRTYLVPESGLQYYYDQHSAAYEPPEATRKPRPCPAGEVGRI